MGPGSESEQGNRGSGRGVGWRGLGGGGAGEGGGERWLALAPECGVLAGRLCEGGDDASPSPSVQCGNQTVGVDSTKRRTKATVQ